MAYKILMALSYLGIVVGVILAFWVIRGGALCFMFSIACAHIAGNQKAEAQSGWTQETLYIVLSLLNQLNDKVENLKSQLNVTPADAVPPVSVAPVAAAVSKVELREVRSGHSDRV